jgi:hypothetical protein
MAKKTFRFKLYRFVGQTTGEVAIVEIKAQTAHGAYKKAERLCLEGGPDLDWQHDPAEEGELDVQADVAEFEEVTDQESSEN